MPFENNEFFDFINKPHTSSDKLEPFQISDEQMIAFDNVANILGSYYQSMIKHGLSDMAATTLTMAYYRELIKGGAVAGQ